MVERWITRLGVVVFEAECPGEWWGFYDPLTHAIVLRPDLAPLQRLSTLAHELGHAYYRHEGTTPRNEAEASEWAARALIRPCEFHRAAQVHDSPEAVANELNVLPRDVVNFARWCPGYAADGVSTLTQDATI